MHLAAVGECTAGTSDVPHSHGLDDLFILNCCHSEGTLHMHTPASSRYIQDSPSEVMSGKRCHAILLIGINAAQTVVLILSDIDHLSISRPYQNAQNKSAWQA